MELAYPLILIIGIIALVIIALIKISKKDTYKSGKKIANTKYAKNIPYYKEMIKRYKILSNAIKGMCILCILLSLLLVARPVKIENSENSSYNRDIFLCMDASTSVDELNMNLVKNFKDVVKSLNGDRVGITIFNTSSVVLVPLTDDYDYVNEVLDELHKAFKISYDRTEQGADYQWSENYEEFYLSSYLLAGTVVGNEVRGSSIIGDGLASCIYNFPNLDEDLERTRIVIFSTDNELYGEEIITLQEAGDIAKEKNVTVYGIAPGTIMDKDEAQMKAAVEKTGGKYYIQNAKTTVKEIVKEIERHGKSLMKGQKETKMTDKPEVPFIMLTISIFILFILNKKVNL